MQNITLRSFVKTVDNDITTVKLIESFTDRGDRSYTVEFKQGLFITELQYGFDKVRALVLYGILIDNKLDIYIDKFSRIEQACSLCGAKKTMLIQFDNGTYLCENCAAQNGLDN